MAIANVIDPKIALAAVTAMNAKIDEITDRLATTPADQLTVRTIPAVTVGKGPDERPALEAAPPEAPASGAPTPDVVFGIRAGERTDAEVFDRIGAFLDPTQMGPLFVSKPIRRRIYFGKYPSFAESLSSEKIIGPLPKNISPEIAAAWEVAGELGVTIKGYLFEHDPGIEHILANPGDPTKWPALRRFVIANNRDPNLGDDILEIWKQYLPWKRDVTPTEAELEKYWGLNGSAPS